MHELKSFKDVIGSGARIIHLLKEELVQELVRGGSKMRLTPNDEEFVLTSYEVLWTERSVDKWEGTT